MKHPGFKHRSVDTSYRERRRINRLLDFLTRDQLTRDQLERIGRRLQKSGRRALPPLVRRLWKEQNQERLYRYTCMLDFFDATTWLDQLVALTIKRRDLAEEGRLPLLDILQDYGIDTSCPPFNRTAVSGAQGLQGLLDRCLQEGVWGLIRLMDHLLDADQPLRDQLISRLGQQSGHGPEAAACLRMLACFEFREIAEQAIEALGTLRHPCSLAVLQELPPLPVDDLESLIQRSIRRLNFLGIQHAEPLPPQLDTPLETVTVQAGPLDCYGIRTIWISWRLKDQTLAGLVLQLGEHDGVRQAVSSRFLTQQEHDDYLDEVNAEEGMFPIEASYALLLLKDALHQSRELNFYLPPDLYASRYLFGSEDLRPETYLPGFPVELLDGLLDRLPSLLAGCDELLDEPFFEGWMFTEPLAYELAEPLGQTPLGLASPETQQLALERFCTELLEPDKPALLRRLLLVADYMQRLNCHKRLIQKTLALGLSLSGSGKQMLQHPFTRRLAFDSIEMARQALVEGFDPRQRRGFEEDEDWQ